MEPGEQIKREKLEGLIEAIFTGSPIVYEAYSVPDQELRTFSSKEEVLKHINEVFDSKENLVYLSIHYPESNGYVFQKKIDLIPEKCNGARVRYSAAGWGLVQFQLWRKDAGLFCNIGANSEKRAQKWESTIPEMKSPTLWDWKEVQKECRRLNRVLKQSA